MYDFVWNEFITLESMWIFSILLFLNFFETLKNERKLRIFGCFVAKFLITLKNFPNDSINSFTVIALSSLENRIFKNVENCEKKF